MPYNIDICKVRHSEKIMTADIMIDYPPKKKNSEQKLDKAGLLKQELINHLKSMKGSLDDFKVV